MIIPMPLTSVPLHHGPSVATCNDVHVHVAPPPSQPHSRLHNKSALDVIWVKLQLLPVTNVGSDVLNQPI